MIISLLDFFRNIIGLLGTVSGMIKAFGALAAAELQIKQHLQQVFLKHLLIPQQVLNFSCSDYLLQLLYI
jgi:hypothetical protein